MSEEKKTEGAIPDRCLGLEADGSPCQKPPAYVDLQRGGLVCAEHRPEGEKAWLALDLGADTKRWRKITQKLKVFLEGEETLWGLYYLDWGIVLGLFFFIFFVFPLVFPLTGQKGLVWGLLVPFVCWVLVLRALVLMCVRGRLRRREQDLADEFRDFVLRELPQTVPELSPEQVHLVYRKFEKRF